MRDRADIDNLTSYPKVITAGTGPQEATEWHLRGRGRSGGIAGVGEKEKSVICECLVQLSVVAELHEVAGVLASINNALRESEKMRWEEGEDIRPGLRDKPEWVQFSGITHNDRGEWGKKGAGDAEKKVRGELGWCVSESGGAPGGPRGPAWMDTRLLGVMSRREEGKREKRRGQVEEERRKKEEGEKQMVYDRPRKTFIRRQEILVKNFAVWAKSCTPTVGHLQ